MPSFKVFTPSCICGAVCKSAELSAKMCVLRAFISIEQNEVLEPFTQVGSGELSRLRPFTRVTHVPNIAAISPQGEEIVHRHVSATIIRPDSDDCAVV